MDTEVLVYVDTESRPVLAGRLHTRQKRTLDSASFEYDEGWLAHEHRFSLEPALKLGSGPFHTTANQPLFGAMGDSAPDRWGRLLMRRAERLHAQREGRAPRALREIDYLLRVDDGARQGALRFKLAEEGPFLAAPGPTRIPPLIELPRLLLASERVLDSTDTEDDLRILLVPGSSLGGARPKASVVDRDGSLAIAKLPRKEDEISTVRWEAVALALAGKAGVSVPQWRLESAAGKPVLVLRRFDRLGSVRVPFLSALSMLGARDNESRSYLEIADALRQHGAAPKEDLRALWRRIVFSVLVTNTDDHLRNHGFLWPGPDGWRLSPAYDLNPVPADIKPRVLSTAIDLEDATASMDLAFEVAAYFELDKRPARKIAAEVAQAVSTWRRVAKKLGVKAAEIDRMASAFDHEDLEAALGRRASK
jgi:serine/threonine-protein kinase HipA